MKKVSILLVSVFIVMLLSSCSMHLSKILGGSSNTPQAKSTKTKHIKATHTPPSPPSSAATPGAESTPTSTGYQPSTQQAKAGSTIARVNTDSAIYNTQLFGPTS